MSAAESKSSKATYDAAYYQNRAAKLHEIGPVPKVKYPKIRDKCFRSLRYYLEELFNEEPFFSDPFGSVQISSIEHEEAVLRGQAGNINKLDPRGYGKSTRSIIGATWADITGVQDFAMVCSDSTDKASDLLGIAHMALCENEKVRDCFPEVYAFHAFGLSEKRTTFC